MHDGERVIHPGFGLGLRPPYYEAVASGRPSVDWLEIISENYMIPGGPPLAWLDRIRADYPIAMHGVSLSIGSLDPLDMDYLRQLKALTRRVEPMWVSDHLCWTGLGGVNLHDLLPLPYSEAALDHVVSRIEAVQEYLERQILLENVSSYVQFTDSDMSEWEFLTEVARRADCLLLLDINNVYVSSYNHGFDPDVYIDHIPVERIRQIHLAGHENCGTHIIDTHDAPIVNPVWDLFARAIRRTGPVATMIERDDHFPPLDELLLELDHARSLSMPIDAEPKS